MDNSLRLLLFSLTPSFRRFFYFDIFLYTAASLVALLLLIPRKVLTKQAILVFAVIIVFAISNLFIDITRYSKYLFLLFFLLFYQPVQKNIKPIQFNAFVLFFFLFGFWSVYQNIFGFSQADIGFLNSGVGNIAAEGYLSHIDIRPFSLFSGVAEATFFYLFSAVYFLKRRNYLFFALAIYLAMISGSRGVLVGFAFCCFWVSIFSKVSRSKGKLIIFSMIFGAMLWTVMFSASSFLSFIQGEFDGNRLVFYGSMKGRVFVLLEFASSISVSNLVIPVFTEHHVLDNILAMLWNDFGLIGALLLLYKIYGLFYRQEFWARVFLATFITYGFFADQILSLFLLVVFSFGINLLTNNTPDRRLT